MFNSRQDYIIPQIGYTQDQLNAAIEAAVLAEREACAKVCKWVFENRYTAFDLEAQEISENCAAAIRARGE